MNFFNVPYKHKYVLLSIKPEYTSAIAKGIKKVEFRKRIFSETVERAFVYSSSPMKKIIGSFLVSHIEKGLQIISGRNIRNADQFLEISFLIIFKTIQLLLELKF